MVEFVRLPEAFEDPLLRRKGDADPGVLNVDPDRGRIALEGLTDHLDRDAAPLGELDRVGDQIDQDLPEFAGRPVQPVGHRGVDLEAEREALADRLGVQQGTDGREQRVKIEVDRFRIGLAGLDLGNVEDVADHLEQALAGIAHGPHHVELLAVEPRPAQQTGHADDRVQRGPQLVAHGRQEAALGLARLLGARQGRGQLGEQRRGIGRQDQKRDPEARRQSRLRPPVFAQRDHHGKAGEAQAGGGQQIASPVAEAHTQRDP